MDIWDLTVGNNAIKFAQSTIVKRVRLVLPIDVLFVMMAILLKLHQMKLLLFALRIHATLPTVYYAMLEVILVFNVSISIMFGIGVKMLVCLMFVLFKTVISVKLIRKNVNNVKAELFHTFLQADVQQQTFQIVLESESVKMEHNVGIVIQVIKLILIHGWLVIEFVKTQIVWIVQTVLLFARNAPKVMESRMFLILKINVLRFQLIYQTVY